MDGVVEGVGEGVDQNPGVNIVEGQNSLVAVHVDSDAGRPAADRQDGGRLRPEGVVALVTQAEEPVAMGGADGDFPLTIDRSAGHAQVPVCLLSYQHLSRAVMHLLTRIRYVFLIYEKIHLHVLDQ